MTESRENELTDRERIRGTGVHRTKIEDWRCRQNEDGVRCAALPGIASVTVGDDGDFYIMGGKELTAHTGFYIPADVMLWLIRRPYPAACPAPYCRSVPPSLPLAADDPSGEG